MQHYCGNKAKLTFEKFNCIHSALLSKKHCWQHIKDNTSSLAYKKSKCNGMPMFVHCILPVVRSKCYHSGEHIFIDSIHSFGCPLQKELVEESRNYVAKMNKSGEFTDEIAKTYIRNELLVALSVLDDERNAKLTIERYMPSNSDNANDLNSFSTTGLEIESKIPEQSYQINSTNGLISQNYLGQQIANNGNFVPADEKNDSNFNNVEEKTFLEFDPTVEIAFDDFENAIHISKSKCTTKQEDQITYCYEPMIKLWNEVQSQNRSFGSILLPFLNYYPNELSDLCDLLDIAFDNCLTTDLVKTCQDNTLVKFVDEHFGVICLKTWANDLLEPFACFRKVSNEKKECVNIIQSNDDNTGTIVCEQMSNFFDCLLDDLQRECLPEAQSFLADIITNYGCSDRSADMKKMEIIRTENNLSNNNENQQLNPSNAANRHSIEILDGELFSYQLSMECTKEMQSRTQLCFQPLIDSWKKVQQQRPILKNISFPMYKYTRQELLELCDDYANAFLCADYESIKACLNDEKIRFCRDHFGYICTPQNINCFMDHYDCIMNATTEDSNNKCQIYITGKSEPGNDSKKCRGIRQYYNCIKPEIIRKCSIAALKEFETSIYEYGCDLN